MKWSKVLVLTFKPAVQSAWEQDLKSHIDFKGWQFIPPKGLSFEAADKKKPFVCFGSFQDYLGRNEAGGIKVKTNGCIQPIGIASCLTNTTTGAWRENAKELF